MFVYRMGHDGARSVYCLCVLCICSNWHFLSVTAMQRRASAAHRPHKHTLTETSATWGTHCRVCRVIMLAHHAQNLLRSPDAKLTLAHLQTHNTVYMYVLYIYICNIYPPNNTARRHDNTTTRNTRTRAPERYATRSTTERLPGAAGHWMLRCSAQKHRAERDVTLAQRSRCYQYKHIYVVYATYHIPNTWSPNQTLQDCSTVQHIRAHHAFTHKNMFGVVRERHWQWGWLFVGGERSGAQTPQAK